MRGGLDTRRVHRASQVMQLVHSITWRHRWTYSANSAPTQPAQSGASSVAGTSGSTVGRRSGTSVGAASGPFAETIDTPFYRLHKPAELAVLVLTLLSHGCPTPAIVAAFGPDVQVGATASYVKFSAGNNFAEILARKYGLLIYVRPEGLDIAPNGHVIKDGIEVSRVPESSAWTLNCCFKLISAAELEAAEAILRGSYKAVSKVGV
jgi:hypothetical protein